MVSRFGFRFKELKPHPDVKTIQERMKTVVQLRYSRNSEDYYLGTGFFLCNNPPILLTACHVIKKHVVDSKIEKRVYIQLNHNNETFKESENNRYQFDQKDHVFLNKEDDFAIIILLKTPTKEIEFIFPNISFNLPPPFPIGIDPDSFSSYLLESNISMIHHPTEKSKYIATAYKEYRVVHLNWEELLNNSFMERTDQIVERLKTNHRFVYWALDSKKTPPFIPCTDHGSSGSPIFNNKWKLIGMHIEGSRVKTQNDKTKYFLYGVGIPISLITDRIQSLIKII